MACQKARPIFLSFYTLQKPERFAIEEPQNLWEDVPGKLCSKLNWVGKVVFAPNWNLAPTDPFVLELAKKSWVDPPDTIRTGTSRQGWGTSHSCSPSPCSGRSARGCCPGCPAACSGPRSPRRSPSRWGRGWCRWTPSRRSRSCPRAAGRWRSSPDPRCWTGRRTWTRDTCSGMLVLAVKSHAIVLSFRCEVAANSPSVNTTSICKQFSL